MDFKIKISLLLTIILFAQFQSNAQIGLKTKKSSTKLFNTANDYVIGGITISGSEYLDEELLISISGLTIGVKIKLPNDASIAKGFPPSRLILLLPVQSRKYCPRFLSS